MLNMADIVISRLKREGFKLQRYDSVSTNSIYIKLDYGLGHSIRISDHPGKKHLQYRYNLAKGRTGVHRGTSPQGWPRYYYGFDKIDVMIADILYDREFKLKQYGVQGYALAMDRRKKLNKDSEGFWSHCVEV